LGWGKSAAFEALLADLECRDSAVYVAEFPILDADGMEVVTAASASTISNLCGHIGHPKSPIEQVPAHYWMWTFSAQIFMLLPPHFEERRHEPSKPSPIERIFAKL
jgi:hypothetical protein